jgi:cell division protein FtsQ
LQPLTHAGFPRFDLDDSFFEPKPVKPVEAPQSPVRPAAAKEGRATLVEAWSDAASRLGFVVSFFFLVAVGLYAFSISGGGFGLASNSPAELLDKAAYRLGFAAKDIVIDGRVNLPDEVLRKAIADPHYRSLILYDTGAARDRLLALGWVAKAEIQRTLPDRLRVSIIERKPFALWRASDGALFAIDKEGRKLGSANGRFANFQVFAGEGAAAEAASLAPALSALKQAGTLADAAELVAGRYWKLTFDSGLAAKLPREPDEKLIERLAGLLRNPNLASDRVSALDLRMRGRIIVELNDRSVAARDKLIGLFRRGNEPITLKAKKAGAS